MISSAFTIAGNSSYALAAYKGQARPNLMSWSLWSAIPLIMFFAQRSESGGSQTYLSLVVGLTPLLIIFCAWYGGNLNYKVKRADMICVAMCIATLILWAFTGKSLVAMVLSIGAGTYAGMLTLLHGYHHPEEENALPFLCGVFSAVTTLLTLERFDFMSAAFAAYLLLSNVILAFVKGTLPRIKKS